MRHQKALLLTSKQGPFVVGSRNIPEPGPDEVLIRVEAAALNPIDWKIQAYGIVVKKFPAVLGSDITGVVDGAGQNVTWIARGDRVWVRITQGVIGMYDHSGFQQYALGYGDLTAKIPDWMTFDEAAGIPLALGTASLGLYNETMIQLARLSGFSPIITTASPQNAPYLLSLGATHVLDRHLPASRMRSEILQITSKPVETIHDAVSLSETQNLAYDLLAPGGSLVVVLSEKIDRKKRTDKHVVQVNATWSHENRDMGISLYDESSNLIEDDDIKPNRVEVLPGGLSGISSGLKRLRAGVSNVKLVAHPQH